MYVDKLLSGLNAVQTLSRLNRIHPDKDGTFILDFRNDAEEIRAAFQPYYGTTVAPPTDPNLLYDTRHALDEYGVLWPDEIETVVALLLIGDSVNHGRVHAALAPAIDRFTHLEEDEQERFVDALQRFVRTYGFLSQVVSFTDAKLHRDYLYCKALAAFTKVSGDDVAVDAGSLVELTHLRIEQQFEGSVTLSDTVGEVVVRVRRQRQAPRAGRGAAVSDHRADQRTVRHQLRPDRPAVLRRRRRQARAPPRHPAAGRRQLAGELRPRAGQGVRGRRHRPDGRRPRT